MKIKRIRKLTINCFDFTIVWDKSHGGGGFRYTEKEINIGVKGSNEKEIFMIVCHELMEICAVEMNVRYSRPDCDSDYLFSYDHRQHETMINMFSGLLSNFIE